MRPTDSSYDSNQGSKPNEGHSETFPYPLPLPADASVVGVLSLSLGDTILDFDHSAMGVVTAIEPEARPVVVEFNHGREYMRFSPADVVRVTR